MNMPSYGFCFRPSVRQGNHAGRLSRSVTTPYRIYPDEWDGARKRLITQYDSSERGRQLSNYESSMIGDLRRMDTIIGKLEKGGSYTVNDIMIGYHSIMSGNSVGVYAEAKAAELERSGYTRTAKAYRTAAVVTHSEARKTVSVKLFY
jgi:hypothetical protein